MLSAMEAGGAGFPWAALFTPLARLILVMTISLAIALFVEALRWTDAIARLAAPLVRFARMNERAGASFALAFVSPAAANALLAEGISTGEMTRRELVAANILNSTPSFLVHLPSLIAMAFAFLGKSAFAYIGIVLAAALLRTAGVALFGRLYFPRRSPTTTGQNTPPKPRPTIKDSLRKAGKRFVKRLRNILLFTVPIYCLFFWLQYSGAFAQLERFLAGHTDLVAVISPQAIGITALYVAAESGAAFSAAAALLGSGTILPQEAVTALLIGNILSSPIRAFRHQLPSYAGFFKPGPALLLVSVNQGLRALTLAACTALFIIWA